jgi:hypothetical protein
MESLDVKKRDLNHPHCPPLPRIRSTIVHQVVFLDQPAKKQTNQLAVQLEVPDVPQPDVPQLRSLQNSMLVQEAAQMAHKEKAAPVPTLA